MGNDDRPSVERRIADRLTVMQKPPRIGITPMFLLADVFDDSVTLGHALPISRSEIAYRFNDEGMISVEDARLIDGGM